MKKLLYVQTSGIDTPERTYAPFILATTAQAMGVDTTIYFLIKGLTIVQKGEAAFVRMGSFPALSDVIQQAVDAGVTLYACEQSAQLLGLEKGSLRDDVEVVGAATLNKLVLEADGTLYF